MSRLTEAFERAKRGETPATAEDRPVDTSEIDRPAILPGAWENEPVQARASRNRFAATDEEDDLEKEGVGPIAATTITLRQTPPRS